MRNKILNLFLISILTLSFFKTQGQEKIIGEVIENQEFNKIGTFDFPGVSCKPLGAVYLSDSAYPDLFLRSDN